MTKKILITGGTGFIGYHLAKKCLKLKWKVTSLSSNRPKKVRKLKKPLETSGIEYEQIIKSINNLASSKATLDEYFYKIFKDLIKKNNKIISINFKKFIKHNKEVKIALINESIKRLKNNYYNPRSKKVDNLIKNIENRNFKKSTLGGCIFILKKGDLCLKVEKT